MLSEKKQMRSLVYNMTGSCVLFLVEKRKWGSLWLYYILGQRVITGISLMRPSPVLCEGANPH